MLILAMIFANVVLCVWSIILDPIINNDGITYLAMAELYVQGDWNTANSYYSWPFYPLLIALTSTLLFLDVTTAAYVLNTLLTTSMTLAFVAVVGELADNNRRIVVIAALVILFFPSITKYRSYIIRDFGYLSFYLWSLYFIFRFCRTLNKKHLIGWLGTTALSCLFRFEGIILMLVAPYFLFVFSMGKVKHRRKILASLSAVIIVVSVAIISWYLQDKYQASVELAQQAGKDINTVFELLLSNIKDQFGQQSNGFVASVSLLADNTLQVNVDLIRRMAGIYFVICLFAYWKGFALNTPLLKRIWLTYLATNLVILIGFATANNLTVSRYTLATGITLLLLAPFALNYWLEQVSNPIKVNKLGQVGITFLLFLVVAISIKNLDVRTDKTYLASAGVWLNSHLETNSDLDTKAKLFSNDRRIVHYAKLSPQSNFIDQFSNQQLGAHLQTDVVDHYQFIALSVSDKDPDEVEFSRLLTQKYGDPIKVFSGHENRRVAVFATHPH